MIISSVTKVVVHSMPVSCYSQFTKPCRWEEVPFSQCGGENGTLLLKKITVQTLAVRMNFPPFRSIQGEFVLKLTMVGEWRGNKGEHQY